MQHHTPDTTMIRLRLTPQQADALGTVQRFCGLPSLSATAARLVTWNADALAAELGNRDASKRQTADIGRIASAAVTAAFREASK